jgi:tRNA (mo5U34)-methyltransferase
MGESRLSGKAQMMASMMSRERTYEARRVEFNTLLTSLGYVEVEGYQWYHTVDLGDGLITPGIHDYRTLIEHFELSASMDGMRVLDVGPATGFFSFQMEHRGATVVGLEVPSLDGLDRFPGQTVEDTFRNLTGINLPLLFDSKASEKRRERLYIDLIRGPFEVCAAQLRSRAERNFMSIYDVSPATVGAFDLVLAANVLLHTIEPMRAIAAIASVCTRDLVIVQDMHGNAADPPALEYVGGENPDQDNIIWWLPNVACLLQFLRKLKFRNVRCTASFSAVNEMFGTTVQQTVIRATR